MLIIPFSFYSLQYIGQWKNTAKAQVLNSVLIPSPFSRDPCYLRAVTSDCRNQHCCEAVESYSLVGIAALTFTDKLYLCK